MDLRRLYRALGRAWYVVALGAIFGAAGGLFLHSQAKPEYQATVQMVMGYDKSGTRTDEQSSRTLAGERADSLVLLAPTEPVVRAAMREAGVDGRPPRVSAAGGKNAWLFSVTVVDRVPRDAAAVANAYPKILLGQLVKLVGPLDSGVRLNTTARAEVPTKPIGPGLLAQLGLGLAAGLALGLIGALLLELLDSTVRESDDVSAITGLVGLGSVPFSKPRVRLPTDSDPRGIRSEAYRQIRTSLTSMQPPPQVIAVTSATSGEGKTSVTTNVATTLTRAGYKVLLIDADLRRSTVGEVMDVPLESPGLAEVLLGTASIDQVIRFVGKDAPHVLPAGAAPANPSELLAGTLLEETLKKLRDHYEFILIDTPPVIPVTDALVVAPHTDAVVLVARIGYSTPARLRRARAALDRVSAPLVGCVANCAVGGADRDYRYGYGRYTTEAEA